MHGEQKDETAFEEFHDPGVGPAQEAVESRCALQGEPERQEMQRQENREREPGQPVHQRRVPQQMPAMSEPGAHHGSTTAATAKSPSASSSEPNSVAKIPALPALSGDHSIRIVRTPIDAWIAAATTNAE